MYINKNALLSNRYYTRNEATMQYVVRLITSVRYKKKLCVIGNDWIETKYRHTS